MGLDPASEQGAATARTEEENQAAKEVEAGRRRAAARCVRGLAEQGFSPESFRARANGPVAVLCAPGG